MLVKLSYEQRSSVSPYKTLFQYNIDQAFHESCLKQPHDLTLTSSAFTQCCSNKDWMMSDLLVSQRTAIFNVYMDVF